MNNYNIYAATETDKYEIIEVIRNAGAVLTAVSGCGNGYYIQLDATQDQVNAINKELEEIAV